MLTVPKYIHSVLFFFHPVVSYQRKQWLVGRSRHLELVVLRLLPSATDLLLGKPAHGFWRPSCSVTTAVTSLWKWCLAAKLRVVFWEKVALSCPGEGSWGGMTWKRFFDAILRNKTVPAVRRVWRGCVTHEILPDKGSKGKCFLAHDRHPQVARRPSPLLGRISAVPR